MNQSTVRISGFSDEISKGKTLDQQLSAFAEWGLTHFAIRFLDAGSGVKNALELNDAEIELVRQKMCEYGLSVSSLGSPIGKVKLLPVEDGTPNRYVDPERYLRGEVRRACELARALDTRLIRGFSFYHPRGQDPQLYLPAVVSRLREIVTLCDEYQLTYGLEVEANLVGQTGWLLADIYRQVNHPALVLVFDGANVTVQGYSPTQVFEQFVACKPGLGWLHVKDYQPAIASVDRLGDRSSADYSGRTVDEDKLNRFVPVGEGGSAYSEILADLRHDLPRIQSRLAMRGIQNFFLELEPHLKSGGQFGGHSGRDGFQTALASLRRLLEKTEIAYA